MIYRKVILAIVLSINVSYLSASVIAGNEADPTVGGFFSHDLLGLQGSYRQIADDFSLSATSRISGVTWFGSYPTNALFNTNEYEGTFRVRLYEDSFINNQHLPSLTPIIDYVLRDLPSSASGIPSIGDDIRSFTVSFPDELILNAGTYWFSTQAILDIFDPFQPSRFVWQGADNPDSVNGLVVFSIGDGEEWRTLNTFDERDHSAFFINGTIISEPPITMLFMMGIFLILLTTIGKKDRRD